LLSDPNFGFDDGMEEILSERDTGAKNFKLPAAAQKVRVQKGTKN